MTPQYQCAIVGAGFAGASTAAALARAGISSGIILEREFTFGTHASGRNAGLVRLVEEDPLIRTLALRSLETLRAVKVDGNPVLKTTGALTVAARADAADLEERHESLRAAGIDVSVWQAADAISKFPFLGVFDFDLALWCPAEGVVDIHALLTHYVDEARRAGFVFRPRSPVEDLVIHAGRVTGVRVAGLEISAEIVVDASGAWAGSLGRPKPLRLQPLRRHLCTTGPAAGWDREGPYVWTWHNELYCRPESDGLLMSPCDATPSSPSALAADPAIGDLLATRLSHYAPGLLEIPLRRSWVCLRTFAPDARPFIGPDPLLPGLCHVSGLGGFGMMTSAAIGEAAAAAILGRSIDWLDLAAVSVGRPVTAPTPPDTHGRDSAVRFS